MSGPGTLPPDVLPARSPPSRPGGGGRPPRSGLPPRLVALRLAARRRRAHAGDLRPRARAAAPTARRQRAPVPEPHAPQPRARPLARRAPPRRRRPAPTPSTSCATRAPTATPRPPCSPARCCRRSPRLPEPMRDVVGLVDVAGLSYAETADALDIPIGTVMSRLHRGALAGRPRRSAPRRVGAPRSRAQRRRPARARAPRPRSRRERTPSFASTAATWWSTVRTETTQPLGDLRVGQPFGEQREHGQLAAR